MSEFCNEHFNFLSWAPGRPPSLSLKIQLTSVVSSYYNTKVHTSWNTGSAISEFMWGHPCDNIDLSYWELGVLCQGQQLSTALRDCVRASITPSKMIASFRYPLSIFPPPFFASHFSPRSIISHYHWAKLPAGLARSVLMIYTGMQKWDWFLHKWMIF